MTLSKDPRSGIWQGLFRRKGAEPLKLSMRTKQKAVATTRYGAVRTLYREGVLVEQLRDGSVSVERAAVIVGEGLPRVAAAAEVAWPTVDRAVAEFLEHYATRPAIAAASVVLAQNILTKHFADVVVGDARTGDLILDRVTLDHMRDVVAQWRTVTASENSIATRLDRVVALYHWVERREQRLAMEQRRSARVLYKPFDEDVLTTDPKPRERWLSASEASDVLAATPDVLLPVVGLGLLGGLRLGETLHLAPSDVDLATQTITIRRKPCPCFLCAPNGGEWKPKTKNSARVVPIAADLIPWLTQHQATRAGEVWFFPKPSNPDHPYMHAALQQQFAKLAVRAGLVAGIKDPLGITYHTLRHTFASWLVSRGVDLYTVAKLLGNSLAMVEKVYGHLSPDVKRNAVARLGGVVLIPLPDPTTAPRFDDTTSDTDEG